MFFERMDGWTLAALATSFSITLSKGLTRDEITILALFLSSVSSTLALIVEKIPIIEAQEEADTVTETVSQSPDEESSDEPEKAEVKEEGTAQTDNIGLTE